MGSEDRIAALELMVAGVTADNERLRERVGELEELLAESRPGGEAPGGAVLQG